MKNSTSAHLPVGRSRQRSVASQALFLLLIASAPAFSQTTVWTDGTGNWFTPTNWSAGVPNANTTALINNGGNAQISSSGAAAGEVEIGVGAQDSGTLSTSGAGNLDDSGGALYVGRSGTGNLNITDGGVVSSIRFIIAENAGSDGTVTVTGAGSMWSNSVVCFVGFDGNATLNITNGGQLLNTSLTSIGESTGTGTVTVDGAGSMWSEGQAITIGGSGTGTLTISNGGVVSSFGGTIGSNPGSNGLVDVSGVGSSWTNNGFLAVSGNGGNGTLHIVNGVRFRMATAAWGHPKEKLS
jgi:fibronectin-binding autotransporter adhesin